MCGTASISRLGLVLALAEAILFMFGATNGENGVGGGTSGGKENTRKKL